MMVNDIPVTIVRKKIKHIYISVKVPDGRVVVSAPQRVSDEQIERLVVQKREWILRKQAECRAKADHTPVPVSKQQYQAGETVLLWGEPYVLEDDVHDLKPWYRAKLKTEIAKLLPIWEEKTGLHCKEWRTKDMKTRWGSCNTKAKRIWLNLNLAQYPQICLEYVILHELIHLKVPNHSAAFYAELDAYMPDWKQRRNRLEATLY